MSYMDSLGISASGLTAQRLRLDVIANNIANADTTRTPSGGPYRREVVELAAQPQSFSDYLNAAANPTGTAAGNANGAGGGVEVTGIAQDKSPFQVVYDPSNPDAVNGYVQMPNVDISVEMTDMVDASNAYQANVTAFDTGKQMDVTALNLGK